MKIYNSLDFKSQITRIEKNNPGKYLVHLEDYENLNDLIRRSIRTKSRFVPETSKNAVYDDYLDDVVEEFDNISKLTEQENQPDMFDEPAKEDDAKRSDGKSSNTGEVSRSVD